MRAAAKRREEKKGTEQEGREQGKKGNKKKERKAETHKGARETMRDLKMISTVGDKVKVAPPPLPVARKESQK